MTLEQEKKTAGFRVPVEEADLLLSADADAEVTVFRAGEEYYQLDTRMRLLRTLVAAASAASAAKGAAIMLVFGLGICGCMLLFGLLSDALTRKNNKYILKTSTMLIITMGLMLLVKGIQVLQTGSAAALFPYRCSWQNRKTILTCDRSFTIMRTNGHFLRFRRFSWQRIRKKEFWLRHWRCFRRMDTAGQTFGS